MHQLCAASTYIGSEGSQSNPVNFLGRSKSISTNARSTANIASQESKKASKKKKLKRQASKNDGVFFFGRNTSKKKREIRKQRQARKQKREDLFHDEMFSASWNQGYAAEVRQDQARKRRARRARRIQPCLEGTEMGMTDSQSASDQGDLWGLRFNLVYFRYSSVDFGRGTVRLF